MDVGVGPFMLHPWMEFILPIVMMNMMILLMMIMIITMIAKVIIMIVYEGNPWKPCGKYMFINSIQASSGQIR